MTIGQQTYQKIKTNHITRWTRTDTKISWPPCVCRACLVCARAIVNEVEVCVCVCVRVRVCVYERELAAANYHIFSFSPLTERGDNTAICCKERNKRQIMIVINDDDLYQCFSRSICGPIKLHMTSHPIKITQTQTYAYTYISFCCSLISYRIDV